jgi:hypothetical protein
MFPANAFNIYLSTAKDSQALQQLAEHGLYEPLAGRVLVGEIDGAPAATMSLLDGRVITDPAQETDQLVAALRMRASSIRAYESRPSLRDRIRAALAAYRGQSIVVPASLWRDGSVGYQLERWAA